MAGETYTNTPFPFPAPPLGMQTYDDNKQRTVTYAHRMLRHVVPKIVLQNFLASYPVPQNTADNATFRRPIPWGTDQAKIPVAEGVTPDAHRIEFEDVPVQLKQYVDVAMYTDKMKYMSEDNVTEIMAKLSAEQAAQVFEELSWSTITSGTNVIYDKQSHTARNQVDSKLTATRLRLAVRSLLGQGAEYHTEMLAPSVNYATYAVEAGYPVFCHTDVSADWRDLTGFVHNSRYGTRRVLHSCELGSWEELRVLPTRHFTPFKSAGAAVGSTGMISENNDNVDVYPIMICGKESAGVVPLRGRSAIKTHIVPVGTASASDPAAQRGYYSWSSFWACVILNNLWQARIEVGASDLANN